MHKMTDMHAYFMHVTIMYILILMLHVSSMHVTGMVPLNMHVTSTYMQQILSSNYKTSSNADLMLTQSLALDTYMVV